MAAYFLSINSASWAEAHQPTPTPDATPAQITISTPKLRILSPSDVFKRFTRYREGKDLESIDFYGGPGSFREAAEMTLLIQALKLGGLEATIEFIPFTLSGHLRYIQRMQKEEFVMMGETSWLHDAEDLRKNFYITPPVIRQGEFVVGIYTSPKNKKALAAKNREDILKLSIVSNANWREDIRLIKKLGFPKVYDTRSYSSMLRMVHAQRVDIMLSPFTANENFKLYVNNSALIPIPNIKTSFIGSRHWIVSKNQKNGKLVFQALVKGMQILRKNGTFEKAYKEVGFISEKIETWGTL